MEQYRIGNFTFDTYEDYVRGQADVKNIRKITDSVDIYHPDVALRLYQSIRSGKIKIYSKIGERFLLDLADIIAENAKNTAQLEAEAQEKENHQANKQSRSGNKSQKILGAVCLVAAIVCFVWYFWSDYTNSRGNQTNDYLKQLRNSAQETDVATEAVETLSNDAFFSAGSPELAAAGASVGLEDDAAIEMTVLPEYEAILQENKDFAGWITIEGTKVDYPVMLTKADANYYLTRNFNGQNDINGTLFMDARTNLEHRSTNIIIYGHNMKSGQMFGGLKKYLDEEYWLKNQYISFDTIYEKGTYEIFAVCLAKVQYQNSDEFRYYDFIEANTEEDFEEFLDNIEELSVFTGKEMPVYGDELLTLSTCNNYVEDGRLFLVAKRCKDAE